MICETHGKLTRDHVSPKKCNNLNNTELKVLQSRFAKTARGTISQGGTQYDPSLIELSNAITSLVLGARRKHIQLPQKIYRIITPQRIARAVIGHMLAAVAVKETKSGLIKSQISDALRKYFLDQTLPFAEELFKFLPLGFLITWDKSDSINVNIPILLRNKKMDIDEQEQIEIDLYNYPPRDFPEAPKDWEIFLLNDQHAFVGSPQHKTEQA